MPECITLERRRLLKALRAEITLTPAGEGMPGAVQKAEELAEPDSGYFMPNQFKNATSPDIHRQIKAEETGQDTDEQVDVFVSGVGTGQPITGVSEAIKARNQELETTAAASDNSPVITQR